MELNYKLKITIVLIVFCTYGESLKTKYFKALGYYSLPQLIKKQKDIDAIRFLFNPGGDAKDGDICITLFRSNNGIRLETKHSCKNLWICLGSADDSISEDVCNNSIDTKIDTILKFQKKYTQISNLIKTISQAQNQNIIFDGKFCIVEYATADSVKRVELIPIDREDNNLYQIGIIIFLITQNGCVNKYQEWVLELIEASSTKKYENLRYREMMEMLLK